jgi:hypothetical protein
MLNRSSRLPFALEWEAQCTPSGIVAALWLVCEKEVEVQEFNFSLMLPAACTHWNLGEEEGDFPPFDDAPEWRPVNETYRQSSCIRVGGNASPQVCWRNLLESPLALASALNTGAASQQRVLQWMCRPQGPTAFRFGAGRHALLKTLVSLETE